MKVITVGGLTGGGGRIIGPIIARELEYEYIDREIMTKIAEVLNVNVESVREVDEGISKMLMGSGEVNESFKRAIETDAFKHSFRSSMVTSKTFDRLMEIAKGEKENDTEIENEE